MDEASDCYRLHFRDIDFLDFRFCGSQCICSGELFIVSVLRKSIEPASYEVGFFVVQACAGMGNRLCMAEDMKDF